jgi:hypothetical protein
METIVKVAISVARAVLGQLRAFAVPALLLVVPNSRATANVSTRDAPPVVREVDGKLYVFERGTMVRVPDAASDAVREILTTSGVGGALPLEVGRTIVADGGSGYHGNGQKP